MIDRDEIARTLAEAHYRSEPGITHIFQVHRADAADRVTEPITLLEVNEQTIPSGIMPLGFAPHPASGVPLPSTIIEVTPDEFEQIRSGGLQLPNGWCLGAEVPRPVEEVVE